MKRTCTGKQEVCTRGNDVNFVFKRRNAGKPTILIVANADGTLNQATIASFPEFSTNYSLTSKSFAATEAKLLRMSLIRIRIQTLVRNSDYIHV
jgi:hypothetical protein